MDNVTVKDLIDTLGDGNKAAANDVFNSLMADKINSALDDKRVEIAQQFGAPAVEEPEVEQEEEFVEDEIVDDEVQGISDDGTE